MFVGSVLIIYIFQTQQVTEAALCEQQPNVHVLRGSAKRLPLASKAMPRASHVVDKEELCVPDGLVVPCRRRTHTWSVSHR